MEKKELYRLTRGSIQGKDIELPIKFGIVFETAGFYSLEAYVDNVELLDLFAHKHINDVCQGTFTTENNDQLELFRLDADHVSPSSQRIFFTCSDRMIFKDSFGGTNSELLKATVAYLELEGLQIEFSDLTTRQEQRPSIGQVFETHHPDYTCADISVDGFPYSHIYRKAKRNKNIVVEFHSEANSNVLNYERFLSFKQDYVSLLSLFNGAEVRVRKEYIGNRITGPAIDYRSGIVISYSFATVRNLSYNKYIPLGYRIQNRNPNMLGQVLLFNFDSFREWNKKISLNSIVYYLNGAEVARSIEEKFFIQIIAFERLTALYAEQSGKTDQCLPTAQDFEPIKKQFYDLLLQHKSTFGSNYEKARSILGNLNEMRRLSTRDKMYGVLHDVKIPINDDISELINIIRHKVVHKGEVGDFSKGIVHLYLINELLHEIILRLIDYKGPRNSRVLLSDDLKKGLTTQSWYGA